MLTIAGGILLAVFALFLICLGIGVFMEKFDLL
jgi:hypothetical protein